MRILFAHQGGWDELLMFLVPIALVVGTWLLLERRKHRLARGDDDSGSSTRDESRDGS